MTEAEYILATDLRTVLSVQRVLSQITQANSEHITEDEWASVHRILDAWQARMFNAVKIR